ncbi:MAG: CarD family transcriptional regulator, partial [Eubacterium sp.]|nr:CarD family transcriptional regulator [Eubacterium sp.]
LFKVGDYVVHGNNGVCKVDAVQEMEMGTKTRTYYTLVPLYSPGSKLFVPTDSKKVITRAVMTEEEAKQLLSEWDKIETLDVDNDKNREDIYKAALRSCDTRQWMMLIKTSHLRNQERLKNGKKITTSDERYLQMAQDNLFGELAIPFKMSKGEAEALFNSTIKMA